MSRSQPYRPRIPTHIIQTLDVASRITLFLVDQRGPLCFTFKDRLDNKYKTSIGPELKCSCSPGKNDHCIHTAYVFLKVFRVSVDNPIIWQAAYVDSQLSDLLAWKHTVAEARRPRPTFQPINFELPELPSEIMRKRQKPAHKPVLLSERMKLQKDSVCPICQDSMTDEMCLTYCKVLCGNNFHLECLKIWARHRTQEESRVNCPMCRTPFPLTILMELEQEQKYYAINQSEKIKIEFNCASCGLKNIPNNPHKCLLCTSFQLCEVCYRAKKHIKHPFVRRDPDGRWRGAEERRQDQLKLKNYIDSKRKETYTEQIMKKLRKIDEDPNKLIDYVASSYPYVSRYITEKLDPMKKMDFDPLDIKCFKCGSTRMLFLRRLACGHFIDHECLKDCLIKEKYYCQEDGSQFLKGYQNLKNRQKQIERKRNQEIINLTPIEYDPSHLERKASFLEIDEPNAESYNFQEPSLVQIMTRGNSRHDDQTPQRVGQRFSSNIIRENRDDRATSNEQIEQRPTIQFQSRARNPLTRNRPTSRQKPPIPRSNDIRIRNVSNSNHRPSKQQIVRAPKSSVRREQMGLMIEGLIGRKLK